MAMTDCMKKIQMARTRLLLEEPFFGVLALQLQIIEDATKGPTAYTDGTVMGFNPKFVESLKVEELCAVVTHEVMHCACGHPWRREARDPFRWNVAADIAINPIIKAAGFTLPADVLMPGEHGVSPDFLGKSAEWIYDRLPEHVKMPKCIGQVMDPRGGQEPGDKERGQGAAQPGDGSGPGTQPQMTEADWQQATQQAINAAKGRGKLPAELARQLGEATRVPVDWRSLLRRYIQEVANSDYNWTLPNRRYMAHGFYIPALHSTACGKFAIAVDTSGSIDDVLLGQFVQELRAIVAEMEPREVDVIYCDAKVQRVAVFQRGEELDIQAKGGGGTDFRPVFEHYRKNEAGETPAVLIYFTDMDGTFPEQGPEYPVIWAAYGPGAYAKEASFGDIVPLN